MQIKKEGKLDCVNYDLLGKTKLEKLDELRSYYKFRKNINESRGVMTRYYLSQIYFYEKSVGIKRQSLKDSRNNLDTLLQTISSNFLKTLIKKAGYYKKTIDAGRKKTMELS